MNKLLLLVLTSALTLAGAIPKALAQTDYDLSDESGWIYFFTNRKQLGVMVDVSDLGLKVASVLPNSPAQRAGIQVGDVITAINGKQVKDISSIRERVNEIDYDLPFTVTVLRNNNQLELSATLQKPKNTAWYGTLLTGKGRLGISLQDLTDQLREYFGVEKETGVLIASVAEDSAAAKAGLRAGDVIVSINNVKVSDVEDVLREVGKIDSSICKLQVVRKGEKREFEVMLRPLPTESPRPNDCLELYFPEIELPKITIPKVRIRRNIVNLRRVV
ncbi:MAG: PDZ domain-containing protein [Acidobacteriota bacterium]|nr:PDZ domain-containing protein [Blastocatellia bacterium]MDW8411909.1 PDZ domain-containing protein [Acidobacteriota bacterium]